jgi:hypothetical protein
MGKVEMRTFTYFDAGNKKRTIKADSPMKAARMILGVDAQYAEGNEHFQPWRYIASIDSTGSGRGQYYKELHLWEPPAPALVLRIGTARGRNKVKTTYAVVLQNRPSSLFWR